MRFLKTILLLLAAALAVTAAVFMAIDGNLARLTGWYRFEAGMPLFSRENAAQLHDVSWMRIADLHDCIECSRDSEGNWWIINPFRDRMAPEAVQRILDFTANARLVETLPNNRTIRANMREYGVETTPVTITLKVPGKDGASDTTVARYTVGNASPWLEDAGNGGDVLRTTYLRTDFYGRDKRVHVVSGHISDLFRDGLESLRDPHPLRITPENILSVTIDIPGTKKLHLRRLSSEADWTIGEPVLTEADSDKVNGLVSALSRLTAVHMSDKADVKLPEAPACTLRLQGAEGTQPVELHLYPPFSAAEGDQQLCYATVNDREAVFTLQADRKVKRRGSYAELINAVCELPVFPDNIMGEVRRSRSKVYTNELDLTLPALRSLQFADVDSKDVSRIALSSPMDGFRMRLRLIPGNADNQVEDIWMYAAQNAPYRKAENAQVLNLLKGLTTIPVEAVVADALPGEDMSGLAAMYGLDRPTYVVMLQPNPCNLRAFVFGHDLPLVKDRTPRTFFISRAPDPATGKRAWFGTELGSNTIAKLSPKMTKLLSLRPEKWKNRSLTDFPISAVRTLTFKYAQAELVLHYDYIGESWTGTLGGEDISMHINPNRADYYLRRLQKLKVQQWLEPTDEDAQAALRQPAFTVKIDLDITDYTDAEATIVGESADAAAPAPDSSESAEALLNAESADGDKLRDIAMAERKVHHETRTIEIAPSTLDSDKPFFYGRIVETGELFILSFDDAQGLDGEILER